MGTERKIWDQRSLSADGWMVATDMCVVFMQMSAHQASDTMPRGSLMEPTCLLRICCWKQCSIHPGGHCQGFRVGAGV